MMDSIVLRLMVFLFALSGTLCAKEEISAPKYDVAVVAIFQNEAPYLKEWIEFHLLSGVKHFYLYNNNSTDNYLEILQPYIDKKIVTLKNWKYTYEYQNHGHWIAIQTGAYLHCIKHYGDETEWLAVIDIDEFLYTTKGQKLGEFLKNYKKFGGLAVNWVKFGTSDVYDFPPNTLMIESLLWCSQYNHKDNHFIKSIVQPKYVRDCRSAHAFKYIDGKFAVNADGEKVSGTRSRVIHLSKIRINHYWTGTMKSFIEKKIAFRQKRRDWSTEKILSMGEEFNEIKDKNILIFASELRAKMGYNKIK